MICSNDLKFWELLSKVGQRGSVGVVRGIVGLKFMDLRDNASRFQYSRKMSDVFELSVVNQYKPVVLKIRYPPTLKKTGPEAGLGVAHFFQTPTISKVVR